MSLEFGEIGPWTKESAALERLEKNVRLKMEKITSLITLSPLFFI